MLRKENPSGLPLEIEKAVQKYADNIYSQYIKEHGLMVQKILNEIVITLGIDVFYFDFENHKEDKPIRGIYLRNSGQSIKTHKIILNVKDDKKTQNFTLAHELFHHLLMEDTSRDIANILNDNKTLERAGDFFAACLLMYKTTFVNHFEFLINLYKKNDNSRALEYTIYKLSDIFETPYLSVLRRCRELELGIEENSNEKLDEKFNTEEKWKEQRKKTLGLSTSDFPSNKIIFQPYIELIKRGFENNDLTYTSALKKLNLVNKEEARKFEDSYREN